MSSLPSPNGMKKLRDLIHEHKTLCGELAVARVAASKIEALEERMRKAQREVVETLDGMDCKSDGNAGWERRIMWMLTEMLGQEGDDAK